MNEIREVAPEPVEREAFDPEAYEGYAMGAGRGTERLEVQDVVDEGASSGTGWRGRPLSEFHERYPGEYLEARAYPTECPPFGEPADLAKTVNPKFPGDLEDYARGEAVREAAQPYTVNCLDCSRAVEERWRGRLETAAGLQEPDGRAVDGEVIDRFDEWTGEAHREVGDIEDVRQRLLDAGHGASVVIAVEGHEYGAGESENSAHAFNVVNYQGEVRVIDGQLGRDFAWSPGTGHPMFETVQSTSVHGWDAEGRSLWSK
jgi:hypothetical protein